MAKLGSPTDVDKALQLSHHTRPIDKLEFTLPAIFERLLSENENQRALDVLKKMEIAATELQFLDYDYSIKATVWKEIGELYRKIGIIEQARKMWLKAIELAQAGQNNLDNQQDSVDSFKALRTLSLILFDTGYYEDAIVTAKTITHSGYKEDTLKKIIEHQNLAK